MLRLAESMAQKGLQQALLRRAEPLHKYEEPLRLYLTILQARAGTARRAGCRAGPALMWPALRRCRGNPLSWRRPSTARLPRWCRWTETGWSCRPASL